MNRVLRTFGTSSRTEWIILVSVLFEGDCFKWNLFATSSVLGENWNQAGYGQQLSGDLPHGWNWRTSELLGSFRNCMCIGVIGTSLGLGRNSSITSRPLLQTNQMLC